MNVRVGEKLDIYCPQSSNLEEPLFLKVGITSGSNRKLRLGSSIRIPPPGNQNLKVEC